MLNTMRPFGGGNRRKGAIVFALKCFDGEQLPDSGRSINFFTKIAFSAFLFGNRQNFGGVETCNLFRLYEKMPPCLPCKQR